MANLRLKARFDEEIAAGSQVSLDVLQFEAFALNGVEFIAGQLSNPFLRKVLENLFLCERLPSCCELLNRSYVDGRRAKVAEILADIVPGATQRDIRVLLKELESTKTQS